MSSEKQEDRKKTAAEEVASKVEVQDQGRADKLEQKDDERAKVLEDREVKKEERLEVREDMKAERLAKDVVNARKWKFAETIFLATILAIPTIILAYRQTEQGTKLDSIHGWVNSGALHQLTEKYELAIKLAEVDPSQVNKEKVATVKAELDAHIAQQAKVDARGN
jgi:hypothetical protein